MAVSSTVVARQFLRNIAPPDKPGGPGFGYVMQNFKENVRLGSQADIETST
jgi:hypothetical protein